MKKQQGFGLSELLIALLITSFVMTLLMRQYLSTKQNYHHIQTALEESIDLEWVVELLRDSIRKAGFTPCLGINYLTTMDMRPRPKKLLAIELGSDNKPSLTINHMSEYFNTVLQIVSPTDLLITNTDPLNPHQSILIADCYHAEVQTIRRISHKTTGELITLMRPMVFKYHNPFYVGDWLEERYSIHSQSKNMTSLFYRLKQDEELSRAIHALTVNLMPHQGQTLVQIILGLDKGREVTLETMVRAS